MAIRVLMVCDAEGSYRAQGMRFSLTELVQALEEGGCTVTKAHRYPASDPHAQDAQIASFRFDNAQHFKPADFDEVWLIGFGSSNPAGPYGDPPQHAMSDAEVAILAKFMNDGGGVFATGDHDDLGADLCAKVPRVRSMRRWDADYDWLGHIDDPDFVPNPTKSPPPIGKYRLDTLETGHNPHYEFQDQSDDVPQQITPVMHVVRSHMTHIAGGRFGWTEKLPHPLLCGPSGVIRVLPDHMHEGRCQVPEDLTKTFTIDGQTSDEYPLHQGARVSPEVVAWGRVRTRTNDPNFDDPTEDIRESDTDIVGDSFPVIVAYNGHRAKVGRVVVDATFHHFVNVNVTGVKSDFASEPDPVDAVKALGFLASPEGQAHYAQIKAYWRNIARWICRPSAIKGALWDALVDLALDVRLKQGRPKGRVESVATRHLVRYGASAYALLARRTSPCTVFSWVLDIAIADPLSYLLSYTAYIKLTLPDPPPDGLRLREALQVDKLELVQFALGGIMLELTQPEQRRRLLAGALPAERGIALAQRGAMAGLRRGLAEQAARMDSTLTALKRTIDLAGGAKAASAEIAELTSVE